MGKTESVPVQYANFVGEQRPGESRAIVNAHSELLSNKSPERENMLDAFLTTVKERGPEEFLATRQKLPDGKFGKYVYKSYNEVKGIAEAVARSMVSLGLPKQLEYDGKTLKLVGIFAKSREEWLMTDIACWHYSITNVPLYDTLGEEGISWIFEQTELTTVFASLPGVLKLIAMKQKVLVQSLKTLVSFDEVPPESIKLAETAGLEIVSFQGLIRTGMTLKTEFHPCKPEDLITICYTSGTTAKCKGAEITHRAFFDGAFSAIKVRIMRQMRPGFAFFSYLPLAHVFERVMCYIVILGGLKTHFYQGEINKIGEDIALCAPEALVGVPRVYTKFYDTIMSGIGKLTGFKRTIVDRAIAAKTDAYRTTGNYKHWLYDALALKKIRQAMGGRISTVLCSAAPADPVMMERFKLLLSCDFVQAYGQTETAGPITLCDPLDLQHGSLGPPVLNCMVKVVDTPEMSYYSTDVINGVPTPRGELCVKGAIVTQRYFRDPERTKEIIDGEGWMHTGDIGCLLPNGTVKIIDRKKNIFKLQQGEYVAPERIENLLANTLWVLQVLVYGDSTKHYIVAIVVPKREVVEEWGVAKGLGNSYEELCKNKELQREVFEDLTAVSKKGKLMGFEFVKKVHLSPTPFSIDNGTLTPTLKMIRSAARKMYAEDIARLYAEPFEGEGTSQLFQQRHSCIQSDQNVEQH